MKETEADNYYVSEDSIVRRIWGRSDTILLVFAGASAEFALNKAVDWLYFTGRLPADPLSRLFSTVMYARRIVFANIVDAHKAIDQITAIHSAVEKSRGAKIPEWAFRDVLFMLIYYSITAFEVLERELSNKEKNDLFDVFSRIGIRMGIRSLPENYKEWMVIRDQHMHEDLAKSDFSVDLYRQYKKHLGLARYKILLETQKVLVPDHISELLGFSKMKWIHPLLFFYKMSRLIKLDGTVRNIILPRAYKAQIRELDRPGA